MLGKTFKGLTDEMLEWQTERLLLAPGLDDGWTVHVRPELVAEIAFADVQESPRYPAGLALRFARVKRYRADKTAAEADTIQAVRAIFRASARLSRSRDSGRRIGRFGRVVRHSPHPVRKRRRQFRHKKWNGIDASGSIVGVAQGQATERPCLWLREYGSGPTRSGSCWAPVGWRRCTAPTTPGSAATSRSRSCSRTASPRPTVSAPSRTKRGPSPPSPTRTS